MTIYVMTDDEIRPMASTTFREAQIKERADLQRVLRDRIDVIAPGCLVIAEEFGEWDDSRRRIDLLAIDPDATLVVIELKRTEDGGHMELQAIRYASMVSTMTFEQAVRAYDRFLKSTGKENEDAESNILDHLNWDTPDEDAFGQDVRIVLASAQFSRELTSAVIWLNDRGLDIRCTRLIPYKDGDRVLLDVQQVIPLPEAEAYQVRVREKTRKERESRLTGRDYTKYIVSLNGVESGPLPKRETVLRVVKHLCDQGETPETILNAVTFRKSAFRMVPGEYRGETEFIEAAIASAESQGRRFDVKRWYTADSDRLVSNGNTFVLSNGWGGRAIEWVEQAVQAFPNHGVSVRAEDDSGL